MPIDLRMTPEEREAFLVEHVVGVMSIAEPDGGTLATPIWYEYADGEFVFVLNEGSRKEQALRRVMRLSITVEDSASPAPRYVTATGSVTELRPFEAERDLSAFWGPTVKFFGSEEIAARYAALGADLYLRDVPLGPDGAPGGVVVRMHPRRWLSCDYGKSAARMKEIVEG